MSIVKQIVIVLLLAGAAAGGYYAFKPQLAATMNGARPAPPQGGPAAKVPVETVLARTKQLTVKLEAVGTSRARRSIEVVPLASGRVVQLSFESGERVEEGDVLVELDDDIQRADVNEAEAKKIQADLALTRAQTLNRDNISTRASLEQLEAVSAAAAADLDRARRRLADREIRAPFSGIAGLRQVDIGARVDDSTVITRLDDVSEVELEFSLPESVFGDTRKGQQISATAAAFPGRVFAGSIRAIDNRIDPVARAFKVRGILPNPDLVLPAGMFMLISVMVDQRPGVVVPEEAVVVTGEQAFLFVVEDGKARRMPVTLGLREPGLVEVMGLADGAQIVVRGLQRVRDGLPVEARPFNPSSTTAKSGTAG